MGLGKHTLQDPRSVGIVCAASAAMFGFAYMATAKAPLHYLGINLGALIFGFVILAASGRATHISERSIGIMIFVMALVLLATSIIGDQVQGAARWVRVGPLFVQPSLALLPIMIVGLTRSRNPLSTIGMMVTAAALAIQPDRAMAGMLVAGLVVSVAIRFERLAFLALVSSIVGLAVTLVRPDTLLAMPYVDQILYSSFDLGAFAGLAVLGGSSLLLVPTIVGWVYDPDNRAAYCIFGMVWLVAVLAAALGNYPTPVVGYSGSAVLGYVLSLSMLPKRPHSYLGANFTCHDQLGDSPPSYQQLHTELANSR